VRLLRGVLSFALLLSLIAIATASAWGQTNASMRGTVTDQSGAVIVGAKVTLTNIATGVSHTASSGSDGAYLFDLIPVGKYKLTVEKSGFTTFVQAGITLDLNQNGRQDVSLKVGQSSEVVEVSANVAQVDTTGAVLGKVEDQRMINDLPLADRDTLQLGLLQAGVFAPDPDDGSGNPFSVSGQRSESLTFLLDGGNNTDFLNNNIVVNPNPDAVQEFKILTNNYDAQYGRTSGGIVNQITKSGTNDFHGDLFEFNRNNFFNARDTFLPDVIAKQTFKRNVFGGTIGGPIKKDKTFFFLAYQGWRSREGQVSPILTVLSPAERMGDFSSDPDQLFNPITGNPYMNNQVPVNPVIANYIAKYLPLPNITDPNFPNGFISAPTASIDQDQGVLHLDHILTPHDTLSFVYVINDLRDAYPFLINKGASTGGDVPVGSGFSDADRSQIGSFTWTHTFNGGKLNEFRFAANRFATLQAVPQDTTSPASLGFTNVNPDDSKGTAAPIIFTNSFNLGPSPQGPTKEHSATFEFSDNFTWTHGKHEWKFGGDVSRVRQNYYFDFFNNGSFDFTFGDFTGNEMADFVGGFWDNYFQFSTATYGIRTTGYGIYAQDTWKIRPRLTLNLGLRYEYYTPQSDVHNNILGFFPGTQSTLFPDAPPDILYPGDPGTPNNALVYPDRNNFAPRLGFAWDIFGNSKLVMRGGGGIFYDIEDGALNLQFGGQPPFGATSNIFPTGFSGITTDPIADPFTSSGFENPFPFASRGLVGTFQTPKISFAYTTFPHFRTPYSENFNYGFQWQAAPDTIVEAVYVGSLGRKLISSEETNFPDPTIEMAQLNQFGFVNPDCARRVHNSAGAVTGNIVACTGGVSDLDPNGSPTGATELLTNTSSGLSDSDQFQLTVDKRFSHSFALRGAYTLAKTIDMTSGFRSRSGQYTDPLDHRLDRALADFDTPQRLVISGIWGLPFDRPFHDHPIMQKITGGWQLNAIISFQKGNPFTLYSNNNQSQQNNFLDRVDLIGPVKKLDPRHPTTIDADNADCTGLSGPVTGTYFVDPTAFDCVNNALFTFGTLGRNSIRGPGINNWDLSLTKNTTIAEHKSLEFRAEFFNALNHTQFLNPDNQGFSATFGQITTDRGPRIIQFGLKLYY
jgi:outer membrane receptor protein involved in Fe transport